MTTELQTTNEPIITTDQLELIQKTIAKDATPDELKLFFYDCSRRGVHPLDRLIHFTKRGGKYTPITSIDFMRTRAHETGECAGIDDAIFINDESGKPVSATVAVYRFTQGQRCAYIGTARWSEYCPGEGQDFMWKKMPHTMMGKCAEALALRKAFPAQLAGLYESAEMDQAGGGANPKPMLKMPLKTVQEAPIAESKREGQPEPESLSVRLQKGLDCLVELTGRNPADLLREFSSFEEKIDGKKTGKFKYADSLEHLAKSEKWGHIVLKKMEEALAEPREPGEEG